MANYSCTSFLQPRGKKPHMRAFSKHCLISLAVLERTVNKRTDFFLFTSVAIAPRDAAQVPRTVSLCTELTSLSAADLHPAANPRLLLRMAGASRPIHAAQPSPHHRSPQHRGREQTGEAGDPAALPSPAAWAVPVGDNSKPQSWQQNHPRDLHHPCCTGSPLLAVPSRDRTPRRGWAPGQLPVLGAGQTSDGRASAPAPAPATSGTSNTKPLAKVRRSLP